MRFYLDAFCPKLNSFHRPRAREIIWFWTKCAWNYSLLSIFTIWLLIHIYQIEGKQQISDSDTVWTAEYPMYVSSPFKLFYLKMTGQYTFDVHVLVRPFLFSSRAALQQILPAWTSRQEGLVDNNKFTRIATIVIKIKALQQFSMYVQPQGFASSDSLKPIAIRSPKWHRGASILAVLWFPFLGNMSW